jgi:hypothetical protein
VFITLPGFAATTATSGARVNIGNFSHNPSDVTVLTDTNTLTSTTNGEASADANAEASFLVAPSTPVTQAYNTSFSTVNGDGNNYFGKADSFAGLIGYDFTLGAGETFSFNFNTFLGLETSVDNPSFESTSAVGSISFALFDSSDLNNPLDFFTLNGNLESQGGNDYIKSQKTSSINLISNDTQSSFGGMQESAFASIQGLFSRTFYSLTHLTLIEGKVNQVSACALR